MLMAFAIYLAQCRQRGRRMTFAEWLAARPDVQAAREAIHQNPAGALAPLPYVPPLTPAAGALSAPTPVPSTIGRNVDLEEQRLVLARRKGSTIGRRSILKSLAVTNTRGERSDTFINVPATLQVEGVTDLRCADGLPVYTLGNATVEGLRRLLGALGALPGGATHVVVTDLREELVLYVNGTAYLRRELEMPAAALHHAGIQAAKLEDLERRLRADMMAEAAAFGGRVLLHREVDDGAAPLEPSPAPPGTRANAPGVSPFASVTAAGTSSAAVGADKRIGNGGDDDDASFLRRVGGDGGTMSRVGSQATGPEDITRTTEYQPKTQVSGFWEVAGGIGDIDTVRWHALSWNFPLACP